MLSMKDEASFGGGGSSVNGLIGGVDRNLVIDLVGKSTGVAGLELSAIPVVDRPFSILKSAFVEKAIGRLRVPQSGSTAINGRIDIMRDTVTRAQINWTIPASGQLNAPTVSGTVRPSIGSPLLAQLNKGYEFRATKYDSSGTTAGGATIRVALDADATNVAASDVEISRTIGSGQNNVTPAMNSQTLTAVIYDTVTGKETAPFPFTMAIAGGTYSTTNWGWSWNTINVSGNLPQGTQINMIRAVEYNGQLYAVPGSSSTHTITADGAVSINGYWRNQEYRNGNTFMQLQAFAYYKLSTHSKWIALPTSNQGNIIANPFAEGDVTIGSGNIVVSSTNYAQRTIWATRTPIPTNQQAIKVFLSGKLIVDTGINLWRTENISVRTTSSGSNSRSWEVSVNNQIAPRSDAQNGAPRGDEYFQANAPIAIDLSISPDTNAIGYRLYSRTADYNGISMVYGPWRLAYEGSSNNVQNWQGATTAGSPPTTNSTANYPASRNLQLSFPDGVDRIDVSRGDSILLFSTGTPSPNDWRTNSGRIIIPIEFGIE